MIVFLASKDTAIFNALMLSLTSVSGMIFVAMERPWQSTLINRLNFFNEAIFYLVCLGLICFTGMITKSSSSLFLGWILMTIVTFMITVNLLILTYDSVLSLKLLAKRYRPFLCSSSSSSSSGKFVN